VLREAAEQDLPALVAILKAAFEEYRKTLTVMDTRPSFDSFSQGYVAGWNAKEAQDAQLRCSAGTSGQED